MFSYPLYLCSIFFCVYVNCILGNDLHPNKLLNCHLTLEKWNNVVFRPVNYRSWSCFQVIVCWHIYILQTIYMSYKSELGWHWPYHGQPVLPPHYMFVTFQSSLWMFVKFRLYLVCKKLKYPNCTTSISWHHYMGMLTTILKFYEGNSLATSEFHSQRTSNAELWVFLHWYVKMGCWDTVKMLVIWDGMSLMWCHCNDLWWSGWRETPVCEYGYILTLSNGPWMNF